MLVLVSSFLLAAGLASGAAVRPSAPAVALDYGTFQGKTINATDQFLGIPFASPVNGTNRLTLPKVPLTYSGIQQATNYGPSCPQMTQTLDAIPPTLLDNVPSLRAQLQQSQGAQQSEDCLTINVIRPAGKAANVNLPVLVWIYGGAFELGSTSVYDGSGIVQRSVSSAQPIIYVSMNYRVSGWGFLPGKQVKQAGIGNLGLQDQRFALQWVNQHISKFGGDPTKVTIWGESAGSISVALQMIANGGNPAGLFRGGYMNSGSPISVGPIENGQAVFDMVAQKAGCGNAADPVHCLRNVPFATFKSAQDSVPGLFSYDSLHLAYQPRVDGTFLTDNPQKLVAAGHYAKIPIVNGDCDDEGTLFSLTNTNITTDQQAVGYIHSNYFPSATPGEMQHIATLYPSDPMQGSPFNTGTLNNITHEFKRLAAIQGDLFFQAPRRFFLNYTSRTQNTWTYVNRKLKSTLMLGSAHGTDVLQYYGDLNTSSYTTLDYLINFVNTLSPNGKNSSGNLIYWPQFNTKNYTELQFVDGKPGLSIVADTYRVPQMNALAALLLKYPF